MGEEKDKQAQSYKLEDNSTGRECEKALSSLPLPLKVCASSALTFKLPAVVLLRAPGKSCERLESVRDEDELDDDPPEPFLGVGGPFEGSAEDDERLWRLAAEAEEVIFEAELVCAPTALLDCERSRFDGERPPRDGSKEDDFLEEVEEADGLKRASKGEAS